MGSSSQNMVKSNVLSSSLIRTGGSATADAGDESPRHPDPVSPPPESVPGRKVPSPGPSRQASSAAEAREMSTLADDDPEKGVNTSHDEEARSESSGRPSLSAGTIPSNESDDYFSGHFHKK